MLGWLNKTCTLSYDSEYDTRILVAVMYLDEDIIHSICNTRSLNRVEAPGHCIAGLVDLLTNQPDIGFNESCHA